ncbi:MAG: carbon storage regulator [Pirellulaceae bacterium]
MLVLSRKNGEQIQIGQDIVIRVCRVQGGRVQLGIVAPKNVRVRRSELPVHIEDESGQVTFSYLTHDA